MTDRISSLSIYPTPPTSLAEATIRVMSYVSLREYSAIQWQYAKRYMASGLPDDWIWLTYRDLIRQDGLSRAFYLSYRDGSERILNDSDWLLYDPHLPYYAEFIFRVFSTTNGDMVRAFKRIES